LPITTNDDCHGFASVCDNLPGCDLAARSEYCLSPTRPQGQWGIRLLFQRLD
jgi:hypothetical protein